MKTFPSGIHWVNLAAASVTADGSFGEDAYSQDQPVTVCEKMIRNVKGIIFDFDGTIYDHAGIAFHLIMANPADTLRVWQERLVRARFFGRDFLTSANYYRAFFTELAKLGRSTPQRRRDWYFNRFMPRMIRILEKHFNPRRGLVDFFQKLEKPENKLKVAVYSDYPYLKERMEALGVPASERIKLFDPESFGAQKPAARPFLEIAKSFNLKPEEILVIGDREDTDGLGAYNAGMHFFCLETGRKRYYRLDPYRRKPNEEKQGPTLLMYAGPWDGLINILLRRVK